MRKLLLWFLVASFAVGLSLAKEPEGEKGRNKAQLAKTAGSPSYQILNINNMSAWYKVNGNGSFPPSNTGDGIIFPRQTGSVIYEDGLMWGAKVYTDAAKTIPGGIGQPFRIGGNEYVQGNQAGWINGTGATAVAVDQNLPEVRIYRVRRDWLEMTPDDLARDAGESNEISPTQATSDQIATIVARYKKDWDEWPVSKGAPYIERNGQAGYQAPPAFNYDSNAGPLFTKDSLISGNYDEPGVAGADVDLPADQVLWTAYNDLNRALTTALYGSEPIGVECQVTIFGYKRTDALGNLFFKRFRLINKGGINITSSASASPAVMGSFYIDSMFVAQWSDPDLGEAGDDIIGCDTAKSLGFVYNGFPVDNEYSGFSLPPPSAGYDFLAGPLVNAPGDSGVYNFKRVYGKKNLPMTGVSYFSAGSALSDPRPRNWPIGSNRWWKMLRGYAPIDGPDVRYPFPPGVTPSAYPFAGDPVAGTGHIDGQGQAYSFSPGDRRLIICTGPFTMDPGDTNDIVVANVVGMGADRLSSVSVLKFNDIFVQNTFDALFVVPVAVPPAVRVAELDRNIVLDWGWDPNTINRSENQVTNPGGFVFEGYNVYQLNSAAGTIESGVRLATFDRVNAYSVLQDETFDQASGLIIEKPVQFGTNSGIARTYEFKADALRDQPALNNGQEYYLAVTAYYRATTPGFLPQVLESAPARVRATAQTPAPGVVYHSQIGDALSATHSQGSSEGTVELHVVDPTKVTGDSYRLTFSGTVSNKTYSVTNTTTNTTVFTGGRSLGTDWGSTDEDFITVDGMQVVVSDGSGVSKTQSVKTGNLSWLGGSGDFWGGDPYGGFENEAIIPADQFGHYLGAYGPSYARDSLYAVMIRFDSAAANRQKAYRLVRDANRTNNNYVIGRGYSASTYRTTLAGTISSTTAAKDTIIGVGTNFLADFSANGQATGLGGLASPGTTIRIDTSSGLTGAFRNFTVSRVFSDTRLVISAQPPRAVGTQSPIRVGDQPLAPKDTLESVEVPFSVWDVSGAVPRQLSVSFRDNNRDGRWTLAEGGTAVEFFNIYHATYDPTMSRYNASGVKTANIATGGPLADIMYLVDFMLNTGGTMSQDTGRVYIYPRVRFSSTDQYTWNTSGMQADFNNVTVAKAEAEKINVFPNPYYAYNPAETNRFNRFVTFSHLPADAKIRVFNLAGQLVKTIDRVGATSQFERWDLNNTYGFPVASGVYVAYIDMPALGKTKVLKVAIIQEQEVLDTY